jgi:hypothetical protein
VAQAQRDFAADGTNTQVSSGMGVVAAGGAATSRRTRRKAVASQVFC